MIKFESYKTWINEKFEEDSDPIQDMGIGMMNEVDKFIDNYVKEKNLYVSPDTKTNNYKKLSFCIAYNSPIELVDYLLPIVLNDPKIMIYTKDHVMDILFTRAIAKDNFDVVKLLIEKHNLNTNYDNKILSVYYAIFYKRLNILKYLLENVYDPNEKASGWFIYACERVGTSEYVKVFIDAGIDVNIKNSSALEHAARKGKTKIMRLLLEHGATPNENLMRNLKYWRLTQQKYNVTRLMQKLGYKF